MNRALRRISIAVLVMFVLLLVNVNYLQGFDTASLASKPGNSRAFYAAQNQYQRGSIVTSDGKVIAASRLSSGNDSIKYQRYYPSGPEYAPVTGYYTIFGATGIEAAKNSLLSGNDSSLDVRKIIDLITGKTTKGATVQVTVNSKAQDAAWNALKALGKPGAVVALNPKTGAVLALASYPSFDPNVLAIHDGAKLNKIDNKLLKDPAQPLLNRALQGTYPPGSTFKIVTSSALLTKSPSTTINTNVDSPTTLTLPRTTQLINDNGRPAATGVCRSSTRSPCRQHRVRRPLPQRAPLRAGQQFFSNPNQTSPPMQVGEPPSLYTDPPSGRGPSGERHGDPLRRR